MSEDDYELSVADMFSGAGGFDAGLKLALLLLARQRQRLRFKPKLVAINHWDTAITSHKANHPDAVAVTADVFETDPLELIPGGKLDLLLASPTCTYYSRARGGKPISWDQRKGRMTPQQVELWAAKLGPKAIIIENVPEFREWGPVCKRSSRCEQHGWAGPAEGERAICGKPDRSKKGKLFRAWVKRLQKLGYKIAYRILNAANFGDMTTRERFFLIGRKDVEHPDEISWPEPTHSETGEHPERPGVRLPRWRAAREAIDWKIRGRSIFKRKKPLAMKTLLRILAGLKRFNWPARFVRKLELYILSLGGVLPESSAPTCSESPGQLGLFAGPGVLVLRQHADLRSIERPLPSPAAAGNHMGVVEPLVIRADCQGGNGKNYRGASEPLYTPTTNGGMAVVEPFLFPTNQGKDRARGLRSADEPLDTIVTRDFKGLVEPFVLNRHGDNGTVRAHDIDSPMPTATCRGAGYVVEPFLLSQGAGGAPRSVDAPTPSIPTEGAHALVAAYYSNGDCTSADEPLPTVTTKARFGLVVPVTHTDASNRSRSTDQPLPTITTAARGELAFISDAYGERPGQAARVRSVDRPAPTIAATGSVRLVEGLEDYDDVDILFRMLEPHELACAMGFPPRYHFAGNKGDRTRQIGNAVAVNTAAALVASVLRTWDRKAVAA